MDPANSWQALSIRYETEYATAHLKKKSKQTMPSPNIGLDVALASPVLPVGRLELSSPSSYAMKTPYLQYSRRIKDLTSYR